ncbi:MAG: polymorphic rane protein [Candidatus Sulfotelmatobacter sp.]|nr:polymorphic rane protein [Candidatus Sulfotelmatobacter sp.]
MRNFPEFVAAFCAGTRIGVRQFWVRIGLFLLVSSLTSLFIAAPEPVWTAHATTIATTGSLQYLQAPQALPATHNGPATVTQVLDSGGAQPVSLGQSDFDGDGVQDLAIGYAVPGGRGIIGVRKGNLDAFAPQTHLSWQAIAQGQFPSPFSGTETAFSIPQSPDFLGVGRFAGTDHDDLVAAARGSSTVYLLPGDGQLQFSAPRQFPISGVVTFLAAGRFGSQGRYGSLLVGTTSGQQNSLLVFHGSATGLSLSASYPLPAPATAITFGDLDGDLLSDAVIISGGQLLILHSAPNATPKLETLSLPINAQAIIVGSFVHDRLWRQQMAVLGADGSISIVAHGGFDPRGWSRAETLAMWNARVHRLPNPYGRSTAPTYDGWRIIETFSAVAPFVNNTPLLYSGRISAQGAEDVMVMDGDTNQMALISHASVPAAATTFVPGQVSTRPYLSVPVGGLSARVNIDARPGMIVLNRGQAVVSAMMPLPDPTFVVNTSNDTVDVHPGDGVCADVNGQCSLRAAVMEANANMNASDPTSPANTQDTIMVPAGTYSLTIPYAGTFDASTGHLDINDGVNIVGEGLANTIIQASNGDQVFSILDLQPAITPDPGNQGPGITVSIANLAITGGQASSSNFFNLGGGGIVFDAGLAGTGSLTLNSVALHGNSSTSFGGALAVSDSAQIPGSTVSISQSTIQSNGALMAGGGVATSGPLSFTLANSQLTNNSAIDANGSDQSPQQGGALYLFSLVPTTAKIDASTIATNTSGVVGVGQGGGVWTNEALLIGKGTILTSNSSGADGGGIWIGLVNPSDSVTLMDSNLQQNRAAGFGGAVQVDQQNTGSVNLVFNRIVDNSSPNPGNGVNVVANLGSVTADDNWWGCNQGPSVASAGCDQASGIVPATNIAFSNSANPGTLLLGGTAQVTAMFQDSNPLFASNFDGFVGLPVVFQNPINGTLSNIQTTLQSNGSASVAFTATVAGTGSVQAVADHQIAAAVLAVQDFAMSATPTAIQTVNAGTPNSESYTISSTAVNGFIGTINLTNSISSIVANGPVVTMSQNSILSSGSAILNIATTAATPPGTYTVTINGTCGGLSHVVNLTLVVADFTLSAGTPAIQSVNAGQGSTAFSIIGTSSNGWDGPVQFAPTAVTGLPAGASASFSISQINVADGSSTNNTGLTVFTSTATPPGNYPLTITGTSGSLSHSVQVTLSVASFTIGISSSPGASLTVTAGSPATFSLFGKSLNGFAGTVNLSASSSGIQPTLSTNSINIASAGQAAFTILVNTDPLSSLPGTYTINVTGGSGSITSTVSLTLIINPPPPDFRLSLDQPSESVLAGQFASYNVTALSIGGFNTALLSASSTVSPAGPTLTTFSNPNGLTRFTVNTVAPNTVPATYSITVTVSGGGITHQISMTLNVVPPDFTFTGGGSQTVNAGTSATFPYSLSNVNVNAATINISVSGLPPGATATASPTQFITLGSGTVTVNTTSATPGTYPITIWAIGGGVTHTVTANLTVNGFLFSVGRPGSISPGGSVTIPYSITNMVGLFGGISVSYSGLPSGSIGTLTDNGTSFGSGGGQLVINTTSGTPPGTYTITFTASGGGFTRTAATILTVTGAAPKPTPQGCSLIIGIPKC